MDKQNKHDEDEILASTISTNTPSKEIHAARQTFQRANLLLPDGDLRLVDNLVHELKGMGLRWVNRSLLVRFTLGKLEGVSSGELASNPDLLRLGK